MTTLDPGAVTLDGEGPPPIFVQHLDDLLPARDLLRHRRRYYIGQLDPCASIEFSRGCPWDCTFCSAWTFYGRSYRTKTPERAVEEIEQIREPGLFILDDVAFIQAEHGLAPAPLGHVDGPDVGQRIGGAVEGRALEAATARDDVGAANDDAAGPHEHAGRLPRAR